MREIHAFKIVNEASVLIPSVMMASIQPGWLNAKGPKNSFNLCQSSFLILLISKFTESHFFLSLHFETEAEYHQRQSHNTLIQRNRGPLGIRKINHVKTIF